MGVWLKDLTSTVKVTHRYCENVGPSGRWRSYRNVGILHPPPKKLPVYSANCYRKCKSLASSKLSMYRTICHRKCKSFSLFKKLPRHIFLSVIENAKVLTSSKYYLCIVQSDIKEYKSFSLFKKLPMYSAIFHRKCKVLTSSKVIYVKYLSVIKNAKPLTSSKNYLYIVLLSKVQKF